MDITDIQGISHIINNVIKENEYPCLYLKNPLNLLNYNKLLRQTKLFVSCYLSGKYIYLRYICEHSLKEIPEKDINSRID